MERLSFDLNSLAVFGSHELSPSVFSAIESSLDLGHFDRPLLQNLRELSFRQGFDEVSLRDIRAFLGPSLKTLRLTISGPPKGLGTFTKALKARCPAIEHLYISDYERSERVNSVVTGLLCSLSSLRTISWNHVACDSQTLKSLSFLPFLETLDVRLPERLTQRGFLDASSNTLPFSAMRHLRISVASIADAGEFLQVTSSSPGVKSLDITFDHIVPHPEQLHAVFTVMQRGSFCNTLTTFELRDHVERNEDLPPLHTLDAHTLSPLLQCRNLENITIRISYAHAAIDNALLKEIALAWPYLRRISLDSYHQARLWRSRANLQGLSYLAQHCHSLQSVRLQFDVSLPTTAMHPDGGIRCESLTQLEVSHSHVSDPLVVATFLADVFPNLRLHHSYIIRTKTPGPRKWFDLEDSLSEDGQSPEYVEMAKRWKEVVETLKMRQELSQSPTNPNVRMPSLIHN